MGLPVERIMEEVEEEMAEQLEEDLDVEIREDEEKDLENIKIELVEGDKAGSRWLIVDSVHICHRVQNFGANVEWRCEDHRHFKCPFKILTTGEVDNESGVKIVKMTKAVLHTCCKDKVKPIVHKFKLRLCNRMRKDLDVNWSKIWDEERKNLIEELKESPLLTNQVLLELKDSRSFRTSAQRARAKEMPPIPKEHEEMDPAKVKSFKICYISLWQSLLNYICLFHNFLLFEHIRWDWRISSWAGDQARTKRTKI